MRIKKIYLENFKMFKEKEIEFEGNFSLIIGDNGTGKSSILEGLSIALGGFLTGIDGVRTRNINMDEVSLFDEKLGDGTFISEPQFPCSVVCEGEFNNNLVQWKRSINKKEGRTDRVNAKQIIELAAEIQHCITQEKEQNIILPVFSYQGAGRLYSQKREKWTNPFETQILSRFMGYTDCLEAESNIKLFVNWLRKMTLISLQKNKPIGELTATLEAISNFMKSLVGNNKEVSIFYDFERDEVIVELGDTKLPLRLMSSGYRSLIGMVADIAFRMSLLNPQLKEKASLLTPGVILIDELDLHLHPKWQWKIVEDLKRTFPKVQFIATTHAPIIISSCKNGEIINITGDKYEKSHNFGWQVKDILSEIMESENRSPLMQVKINAYEKLYEKKINESLTEQDKKIFMSLEKEMLGELPESDPIITLAKLNAIKNKVTKVDEDN